MLEWSAAPKPADGDELVTAGPILWAHWTYSRRRRGTVSTIVRRVSGKKF